MLYEVITIRRIGLDIFLLKIIYPKNEVIAKLTNNPLDAVFIAVKNIGSVIEAAKVINQAAFFLGKVKK